jgi:hypothetical protein
MNNLSNESQGQLDGYQSEYLRPDGYREMMI